MNPNEQQPFIYNIKLVGEQLGAIINCLAEATGLPYKMTHPLIQTLEDQAKQQGEAYMKAVQEAQDVEADKVVKVPDEK